MAKKYKPWMCYECRIVMLPVNEDYCKCPSCGTEVWFDYNENMTRDDIEDLMRGNLAKHQYTVYDAMIGGDPVKGGGGRSNRSSSKKQALQKPSAAELYNRLSRG